MRPDFSCIKLRSLSEILSSVPPFLFSIYYIASTVLITLHKLNNLTHTKTCTFSLASFQMQYWLIFALYAQTWKQTNKSNKVPLFLHLDFQLRLTISLCIQMGQAKPYDQPFQLFQLLPSFHSSYNRSCSPTVTQAFFRINTVIKIKLLLIFLYVTNTRVHAFLLWAKGWKHTKLEWWCGEWWSVNLNQQYKKGRECSRSNYFNFFKKMNKRKWGVI